MDAVKLYEQAIPVVGPDGHARGHGSTGQAELLGAA